MNSVNLQIFEGDFVVVMGESGSGKTTLINILSFLASPDSGVYTLFGEDVTNLSIKQRSKYRRENINIIYQKYNLFEELTIYENLDIYTKLCQFNIPDLQQKIKQTTKSLKLYDHINKKVSVLSQGEKQRVAIARNFLAKKKLIIADEPTASVDKENRDIIIQQLAEANVHGSTIIIVTHDSEYLKYATRKFFISYGCVTEQKN